MPRNLAITDANSILTSWEAPCTTALIVFDRLLAQIRASSEPWGVEASELRALRHTYSSFLFLRTALTGRPRNGDEWSSTIHRGFWEEWILLIRADYDSVEVWDRTEERLYQGENWRFLGGNLLEVLDRAIASFPDDQFYVEAFSQLVIDPEFDVPLDPARLDQRPFRGHID